MAGKGADGATAVTLVPNGPEGFVDKSRSFDELVCNPDIAFGGVAAKLNIARRTPTEERVKASRTRGLNRPD